MDTLVQPQTVYFSKFVQVGMTIQKQWSSAWGFTFSVNYISLIYPPQEKEKDSKGKQVSKTTTELKLKKKNQFYIPVSDPFKVFTASTMSCL